MAKLYRMGAEGKRRQPENSAADGPKSVRFDLDDLNGSGSGGEQKQQQILTHIQERFPGFFEMPERCVPFEMSLTVDKLEGIEEQGFPEVLKLPSNNSELTANARSKDAEQNESEAKIGRTKSLFAQSMDRTSRQLIFPKKEKSPNEDQKNTEAIKNLQIIEAEGMEGRNFVGGSEYTRVATDPMQMDLASKCLGNMWPRMEQQITRLFDKLKCPPKSNESTQIGGSSKHTILCQARQKLDDIRSLYLEQIESEESQNRVWTFPRSGGNPIGDSAWMLMPIRRVLDAIQRRSSPVATSDDIEIVRMCMLWTVLLWRERPALFRAFVFVNPSGFYCRLAEIFLIGPELFIGDDITKSCLSIIIEEFLATIGQKGQLLFRLREPIAGLDTFEAFYGELLQRFEDFSSGDANFSLVLLIGAYMNSSKIDGLLMAQALWSPQRNIIRQMTLRSEENAMQILLNFLAEERQVDSTICGEDNARIEQEEANLKTFYAEAMTSGKINAERNPAVYKIASSASPPCVEPMGLLQTPTYLKC